MKTLSSLFLIVIAVATIALADESDELIKLAQSGVDEEVLLAYIDQSADPFDLSADDVIALKDLGVSSKVISEALRHGHSDTIGTLDTAKTASPESTQAAASLVVAPPVQNQNITFLYEALDPYGIWRNVDGEWCWQPNATVIDYSWAPYCNHGHWVYTDWGWAWVSDYTWGWAAFHYGRWFRHQQFGWLWVPGTEWAPAWVSWRTNPDYFGWAPLPPKARFVRHEGFYFGATIASNDCEFGLTASEYCFVPTRHFYDPNPWEHIIPAGHGATIYTNTVVVRSNHATSDNRIVNQGPSAAVVAKITNRSLKPIAIVAADIKPGQPVSAGTVTKDKFIVYKPTIAAAAPETPSAVRLRMAKAAKAAVAAPPSASPQQTNDAKTQSLQKRHRDALDFAAKRQRMAADSAARQQARIEKAAQQEADQKKRAALKADAAALRLKAAEAKQHADMADQLKQTDETHLLKVKRQPPNADQEQSGRLKGRSALVKSVDAEAQVEKRKKKAQEDDARKQTESEEK